MRRTQRQVVVVGAVVALAVAGTGWALAQPSADAAAEASIGIDTQPMQIGDTKAKPIPATFIGANHRWTGDGKGMWNPETNTPIGGIDDLAGQVGLDLVRYPGGTVANLFDFTKAIGAQADRGCQTSGGFADGQFAPVDSRYGPDENEKYVDSFGGESMIMVPTIGRSAQDAANYVEYMNAEVGADPNGDGVDYAAKRAANGHAEPYGIKIWEYGNEPYLPNQRYWRSTNDATKLDQFINGGWQRQTADSEPYADNDGMFTGCDLETRQVGDGSANQTYRVRYAPIALPGDSTDASGPIADTVVKVGDQTWKRVLNLSNFGPDAQVYKIVKSTGQVVFGDGVHGKKPGDGQNLSIEYTSGRHDGLTDFYKAMKQVDPSISVCAGWGKSEFITAAGTTAPYDCLGVHMYRSPSGSDVPALYHDSMTKGDGVAAELDGYRDQIQGLFADPQKRPSLLISEFGTLGAGLKNYGAMLMHNLYGAGLMIGQLKSGVQASTVSNHNAGPPSCEGVPDPCDPEAQRAHGELFGSAPAFFLNGRGRLTSMFSTLVGGTAVESSIANNPIPAGQEYKSLDIIATCEQGTVRTIVVNRNIDSSVEAPVTINNAGGARDVKITTLNGPAVDAYSTNKDQDVVTTKVDQVSTPTPELNHEFPAHSATLLEFTDPSGASTCGDPR